MQNYNTLSSRQVIITYIQIAIRLPSMIPLLVFVLKRKVSLSKSWFVLYSSMIIMHNSAQRSLKVVHHMSAKYGFVFTNFRIRTMFRIVFNLRFQFCFTVDRILFHMISTRIIRLHDLQTTHFSQRSPRSYMQNQTKRNTPVDFWFQNNDHTQ